MRKKLFKYGHKALGYSVHPKSTSETLVIHLLCININHIICNYSAKNCVLALKCWLGFLATSKDALQKATFCNQGFQYNPKKFHFFVNLTQLTEPLFPHFYDRRCVWNDSLIRYSLITVWWEFWSGLSNELIKRIKSTVRHHISYFLGCR